MTLPVHVLPAADLDLDAQAGYLAEHAGLETALRFYDAAATSFEQIARMPGIGQLWQSARLRPSELRIWRIEGFDRHLIFYPVTTDHIEIVRILHGARDLRNVLEPDGGDE